MHKAVEKCSFCDDKRQVQDLGTGPQKMLLYHYLGAVDKSQKMTKTVEGVLYLYFFISLC